MKLEFLVAGVLFLFGILSALRSLTEPPGPADVGSRLLIAVHDAAKAGFWMAFAAAFLAFGLLEEAFLGRLLVVVGLALAAVRLVMATLLARN
jgi:hypothetical protein